MKGNKLKAVDVIFLIRRCWCHWWVSPMFMCIMWLMVASWHPSYAKGCSLTTEITLIENFVIVRRQRRMYTTFLLLDWAQAETNSCPVDRGCICKKLKSVGQVRVHLQTERRCCVQSLVGLSVTPSLNGGSVRGATERNPLYFQFISVQNSCNWVWFSFCTIAQDHGRSGILPYSIDWAVGLKKAPVMW